MLKKDFIIRQFEEFGKVMAIIFGFKNKKDWLNFEKEIKNATQKFTNLEINYLEELSLSDFEIELFNKPTLNTTQLHILADLLFEKLMYYLSIELNNNTNILKQKCTLLYNLINSNQTQNEFNLDVYYKLTFLKKL